MATYLVEEENVFNCMIISMIIIGFEGTNTSFNCDGNARFHEKHWLYATIIFQHLPRERKILGGGFQKLASSPV